MALSTLMVPFLKQQYLGFWTHKGPETVGCFKCFKSVRGVFSGQISMTPALTNKTKKKDHQNQTIISGMAAISVPSKVLFLWTIDQVESLKNPKTCLEPCLGSPN